MKGEHGSVLENALLFQIRALKLPEPVREFYFHPTRKWRADFAWPTHGLLVECEGGLRGGRHTRPKGFEDDAEKYNEAAMLGYTVLRFTRSMIDDGTAIAMLEKYFEKERERARTG